MKGAMLRKRLFGTFRRGGWWRFSCLIGVCRLICDWSFVSRRWRRDVSHVRIRRTTNILSGRRHLGPKTKSSPLSSQNSNERKFHEERTKTSLCKEGVPWIRGIFRNQVQTSVPRNNALFLNTMHLSRF